MHGRFSRVAGASPQAWSPNHEGCGHANGAHAAHRKQPIRAYMAAYPGFGAGRLKADVCGADITCPLYTIPAAGDAGTNGLGIDPAMPAAIGEGLRGW